MTAPVPTIAQSSDAGGRSGYRGIRQRYIYSFGTSSFRHALADSGFVGDGCKKSLADTQVEPGCGNADVPRMSWSVALVRCPACGGDPQYDGSNEGSCWSQGPAVGIEIDPVQSPSGGPPKSTESSGTPMPPSVQEK